MLSKMMEISGADAGTLYILEDDKLHFRIVRNITLNIFQSAYDEINLPPITLDPNNMENICAYCALNNEIVSIDDVYTSEKFNFSGPRNYDKLTGYRTCSMLALPLTTTDYGVTTIIGVMQLLNSTDAETGEVKPFDDIYDPPILPSLANIAANALASLLHAKEIKELFNSFVKVMTKAIDERSPYNVNHTNNIAGYAGRFARYLSERYPPEHSLYFTENRRDQLVMACLLHDIGKIITPLEIMDKPDRLGAQLKILKYKFEIKRLQIENAYLLGKMDGDGHNQRLKELADTWAFIESVNVSGFLSDETVARIKALADITYVNEDNDVVPILTLYNLESLLIKKGTLTDYERDVIQEHASVTSRLLGQMNFNQYYKDVPRWAEGHHEFLDGTGYPQGLSDSQVTLEMCILTILDIYDALTASDRPYKRSMPPEKALDILSSMVGEGKLHGELVRLFAESKVWEAKPE
jgi:HD-GYP domain-containing protein (c-di-GMP phosphodiesterase class II)